MYKEIHLDKWKRKEIFEFFYQMDYPQYNLCFNIDISDFLAYTRKEKLSFYYAMVYISTKAANKVEEFRYRIEEGKVFLYNQVHPSFTDIPDKNSDTFNFVTVEMEDSMEEFIKMAGRTSASQKGFYNHETTAGRNDLFYITCIPWISFTSMSHPISLNRDDAVPRLSWGRYFKDGDKTLLPYSVQVHHALVDGLHVGSFLEKLEKEMQAYR